MKNNIFYLTLIILTTGFNASSQSYLKMANSEAYQHHLSFPDYQVSFFTLSPEVKLDKAKVGRPYYWLAGSQINITNGGYSGKVLNGMYTSFYLNKQLKEQGNFNNGLKHGEWKQWRDDGSLISRINFNAGLEHGDFYRYDEHGTLIEKGKYSHGKLSGKLRKVINGDSVVVLTYRKGVEFKRNGVSWWKFWKKHK
ncbi:toxin-antitoxin system YwqK family antitoxin [Pedobacter sp.]